MRSNAAARTRCIAACAGVTIASAATADTFNALSDFLAAVPDATLVNFDTLPGGEPAMLGEIGNQYEAYGLSFPAGNMIASGFADPSRLRTGC